MSELTNPEKTPRKLDKRAKGAMEFAIYKAEEKGDRQSKQIKNAAAALRKEQPSIPPDEALVHATETFNRLADKQKKRNRYNENRRKIKGKTDFLKCGNCRHEIHKSAKPCPHCSCPWPRRNNWRICSVCKNQTPIYLRRKYTSYNKWDKIKHCAHCGKRELFVADGASTEVKLSPDEITQSYQGGVILLVVVALILFWIFS